MTSVKDAFLADLDRHLHGCGFRRAGQVFSRNADAYTERIQIQGSTWNAAASPWRFYVNYGIAFDDLPQDPNNKGFPRSHCWARLEQLVPNAPEFFELDRNASTIAAEVAQLIGEVSEHARVQVVTWKRRFLDSGSPFIMATQ